MPTRRAPELDYEASEEEVEKYFARKAIAFVGMTRLNTWKNSVGDAIYRSLSKTEALAWMEKLARQGKVTAIKVDDSKDTWYVLRSDLRLLEILEQDEVPAAWQPLETNTSEEVIFLASLDIVSARGRSAWLFDFEYVWEVYKPAEKRRWGYYTLPVLYGDRLVARLDPRLDRKSQTLRLNDFWLEDPTSADDSDFLLALANGLQRFAAFLETVRLDFTALNQPGVRASLYELLGGKFDLK